MRSKRLVFLGFEYIFGVFVILLADGLECLASPFGFTNIYEYHHTICHHIANGTDCVYLTLVFLLFGGSYLSKSFLYKNVDFV